MWLPYVTADYIEATGDNKVLDEIAGYLESPLLGEDEHERYEVPTTSGKNGPVYEHCLKAIDKALRFGEHGLPLMGSGDWNDGMNLVGSGGKGESVWLAWFLYTVLKRFIPICRIKNDEENAIRYEKYADQIKEAAEKNAWDGGWYKRAYFDDGTPLGSSKSPECSIDSISQSWSVISGAAREARAAEAMNGVEKYLIDEEHGLIKLLTPPFDKAEPNPGYIRGYVPGVRENGGQYTHAAVWVIVAFARMGNGDRAWELYNMINPVNHTNTKMELARYKTEPYVMAADVYSVYPHAGRGGWSWYTGAAGWMYRAGLEHILGFKLKGDYLEFDPCIPKGWKEYKITFTKEGTTYDIKIKNPKGVSRGISKITLDEKILEPNEKGIHLTGDKKVHNVQVIMGSIKEG